MKLQFQCPSSYTLDLTKLRLSENKNPVRAGNEVTFRIGHGNYKLRRSDLKTEPVVESTWKVSSAPMHSKAGTIACNHIEIDQALHAAIKGKDFDFEGFGKLIAKLGLPADMAVVGESLPSEVLELAWESFWWSKVLDGKRPDPGGKWAKRLSEADKQASDPWGPAVPGGWSSPTARAHCSTSLCATQTLARGLPVSLLAMAALSRSRPMQPRATGQGVGARALGHFGYFREVGEPEWQKSLQWVRRQ